MSHWHLCWLSLVILVIQSLEVSYKASQMFCFTTQCIPNKTFKKPLVVKSGLEEMFLKLLHALTMNLYFWSKFLLHLIENGKQMEEFQNISSRPLFTVIFRPEMLTFYPCSKLTGKQCRILRVKSCFSQKPSHNQPNFSYHGIMNNK